MSYKRKLNFTFPNAPLPKNFVNVICSCLILGNAESSGSFCNVEAYNALD